MNPPRKAQTPAKRSPKKKIATPPPIDPQAKRIMKIGRDTALVIFAITAGYYEIILGGARPSVFGFLVAVLASPLVLRYDEARRKDSAP